MGSIGNGNTNAKKSKIDNANANANATSPVDDETKVWCVEVVPVAGNRIQALHKMLAQTALDESKSLEILRVIRAYRDDQKEKAAAAEAAKSSVVVDSKPVAVEPFLKPGMNIDQRERARADAKEN